MPEEEDVRIIPNPNEDKGTLIKSMPGHRNPPPPPPPPPEPKKDRE